MDNSEHRDSEGNFDPSISIVLPLSIWNVVVDHLQAGTFKVVAPILASIGQQAAPQVLRAHDIAQAQAFDSLKPPVGKDGEGIDLSQVH